MTTPQNIAPAQGALQPIAAPEPSRGSQARMCGRDVTKCGAHLIFGVGYAVSGFGVFYAVSSSMAVMGGVCAVAICVQAVAHRWWSQYANMSRATENVQDAAFRANLAAIEVQNVTQVGFNIAGRVFDAANMVDQSSTRIANTLDSVAVEELQENAAFVQGSSDDIEASTERMHSQLEILRSTLSPFMGMIGSFRTSLKEIHRSSVNAEPYIKSFEHIEQRFVVLQERVFTEVHSSRDNIHAMLKTLEDEALLTYEVLREQSKHLTSLLEEKTAQLEHTLRALQDMTQRSEAFRLGSEEIKKQLEHECAENLKLRSDLEHLLISLREEREQRERLFNEESGSLDIRQQRLKDEWDNLLGILRRIEMSISASKGPVICESCL